MRIHGCSPIARGSALQGANLVLPSENNRSSSANTRAQPGRAPVLVINNHVSGADYPDWELGTATARELPCSREILKKSIDIDRSPDGSLDPPKREPIRFRVDKSFGSQFFL
jgi:hypothetical protein